MSQQSRPRIALSSCLLGEPVRYDGADKRDAWLLDRLGSFVDYQGHCPEVEIGLGVPRPPIHLVLCDGETRVLGVADPDLDVGEALRQFALDTLPQLAGVSGYVFKSRSPSCGLHGVERVDPAGRPVEAGVGAYAAVISTELSQLAVEEEGRLGDPQRREHFVERVFAHRRWHDLMHQEPAPADLIAFHARHKYQLMAHSQQAYRDLGRLLSDFSRANLKDLVTGYQRGFLAALAQPATRAGHVNVLQHLAGYLKRSLDTAQRSDLAAGVESYRLGEVPLVVPMQLLLHYLGRYPDEYVLAQSYLDPYPQELGLRNRI